GYGQLPLVVQTLDPMRLLPGLRQCGEQQPGEDRDDGDHNQELDQRKALRRLLPRLPAHRLKNLYTILRQTAPPMFRNRLSYRTGVSTVGSAAGEGTGLVLQRHCEPSSGANSGL